MAVLFTESWSGTNGTAWSGSRWKNVFNQSGGAVTVNGSNKGRLNGGTNAGEANAFAQAQTIDTFTDFELTFDMTVQASTTGTADGHKVGVNFRGANDSMINSGAAYRLYFEWLATDTVYFQEKATTTWVTNGSGQTFSVSATDVVHVKIRCEGQSLKAKFWKNADSEPGWNFDVTDSTLTSGSIAFTIHGGTDTTADEVLFSDMAVTSLTNPTVRPGRRVFAG